MLDGTIEKHIQPCRILNHSVFGRVTNAPTHTHWHWHTHTEAHTHTHTLMPAQRWGLSYPDSLAHRAPRWVWALVNGSQRKSVGLMSGLRYTMPLLFWPLSNINNVHWLKGRNNNKPAVITQASHTHTALFPAETSITLLAQMRRWVLVCVFVCVCVKVCLCVWVWAHGCVCG